MRSDQGVNKLNEEEQNLKDFEGAFMANSKSICYFSYNLRLFTKSSKI